MKALIILFCFVLTGCSTSYLELKGECVIQQWNFIGYTMRRRMICDLPPPKDGEVEVRDREEMNTNPFPDLFEENKADTTDENLLEDAMGYPQGEEK